MKILGIELSVDENREVEELDDETCLFVMREMVKPEHLRCFTDWLEQMYLTHRSIVFR